jgi:TldD protein
MATTRRDFLTISGLASAGFLLPLPRAWGSPAGSRTPAPATPPSAAVRAAAAISASPVPADEPLAVAALEAAKAAGASYADARLVLYRRESIRVRDDHVDEVSRGDSYGIGVRVIAEGGWGFAATHTLDTDAVAATAKRAVEAARLNGKLLTKLGQPPVELVPSKAPKGTWVAAHEIDPFSVPVKDKAELLVAASSAVLKVAGVQHSMGSVSVVVEDKLLLTSEGARVHQIVPRIMPALGATAVDKRRGRFASRSHEAQPMQAGWEYVTGLGLAEVAPALGDDALQKLHAASVKPGARHVILAPSNLWLTIHESIGHPTELDRALGFEANFAGTSFITPEGTGKLRIGSEKVHVVADRTQPGGLATVGWDDDAVASGRWDIVKDGIFVGWQTTRDQAAWIGESKSRGCSYGEGYDGVAFQRMPNVSLQPGPEGYTTEDLINATEDGVLVSGRGSWSIDQQRYNFQFSGQMFWEVKRGRITRPLRDVAYQANTVDFWKSCDMVGGKGTYRLGGTFGDGKGEPGQSNACSHGCPPARFTANVVNTASRGKASR